MYCTCNLCQQILFFVVHHHHVIWPRARTNRLYFHTKYRPYCFWIVDMCLCVCLTVQCSLSACVRLTLIYCYRDIVACRISFNGLMPLAKLAMDECWRWNFRIIKMNEGLKHGQSVREMLLLMKIVLASTHFLKEYIAFNQHQHSFHIHTRDQWISSSNADTMLEFFLRLFRSVAYRLWFFNEYYYPNTV